LITNRNPFDTAKAINDRANIPVVATLRAFQNSTNPDIGGVPSIFIVTGREEKYRDVTQQWFENNSITHNGLYMRPTGDKRPDTEVKKEIYESSFKDKYNILMIFEDRQKVVNMYRQDICANVFQVSEGNY
jgi:hypothetical protein